MSAQGAKPGAAPVVRAQVSFLLVAGAKSAPETFVAVARGPGLPVKLGPVKSRPIAYEGPAQLVLYAADAKAKDGRVTLATVALPANVGQVLVLLAPGGNGPGAERYSAVAVDDDVGSMPSGSLRFLNYSGKAVAVQVGKEVLNLGKGPSKAFPVAANAKAPVEVLVQVASQEADGYEKAFSTLMRLRAEERQTFILLPTTKPDGRGVSVVPSRDVIAPPPPKDQRPKGA